jgi:predicted nucleic acid-binding protein
MVVVADTSPINYLVLIGQIDLLTRLYTRILIPPAVLAELKHPLAPKPVREWACDTPKWLEVLSPKDSLTLARLDLGKPRRSLSQLKCMPRYYLLMSRPDGRKQFAEG